MASDLNNLLALHYEGKMATDETGRAALADALEESGRTAMANFIRHEGQHGAASGQFVLAIVDMWHSFEQYERAATSGLDPADMGLLHDMCDEFEEDRPMSEVAIMIHVMGHVARYRVRQERGDGLEYSVVMRDGQTSEEEPFEAADEAAAIKEAVRLTRDWIAQGDWGIEGASIEAGYSLRDAYGNELDHDWVTVNIEPDHDTLISQAGGDSSCEHDWTSEGEGGCDQNPGVWAISGTGMVYASHCRTCGLHRTERMYGVQRNPGDHDTVEYRQPDSWCVECQREDCNCKSDEE